MIGPLAVDLPEYVSSAAVPHRAAPVIHVDEIVRIDGIRGYDVCLEYVFSAVRADSRHLVKGYARTLSLVLAGTGGYIRDERPEKEIPVRRRRSFKRDRLVSLPADNVRGIKYAGFRQLVKKLVREYSRSVPVHIVLNFQQLC